MSRLVRLQTVARATSGDNAANRPGETIEVLPLTHPTLGNEEKKVQGWLKVVGGTAAAWRGLVTSDEETGHNHARRRFTLSQAALATLTTTQYAADASAPTVAVELADVPSVGFAAFREALVDDRTGAAPTQATMVAHGVSEFALERDRFAVMDRGSRAILRTLRTRMDETPLTKPQIDTLLLDMMKVVETAVGATPTVEP